MSEHVQVAADAPAASDPGRHPIRLAANQPLRPYRGGAGIARFRGVAATAPNQPEDFIASTTEVAAGGGVGLSHLPDGSTLRDAIAGDPSLFLGPDEIRQGMVEPGLLVKLLAAEQRLFIHFHPNRAFAKSHLDCPHGKSEAWVILDSQTDEQDPSAGYVYLGFREDVSAAVVKDWVTRQDSKATLAALNRIAVTAGDTFFVPAGIPHSIGPGITLVELQEPTDFSVLLEWVGFDFQGPEDAYLGLEIDVALSALDRSRWTPERLGELRAARADAQVADGVTRLFPIAADSFFRGERLDIDGQASFEADFAVLVVLHGSGSLACTTGAVALEAGDTFLVPWGSGPTTITGQLTALRCRPPAPQAIE